MRQELALPDGVVARIAAQQHGVVTSAQLLRAGLTPKGITRRVSAGRLHRVYRGVYAVGHRALSNEGRWSAAVAACGELAVLSHRSAAELWRLLPIRAGPIHVTIIGTAGRSRRPGLVIHHSSSLLPTERTRRSGIAVTTAARTLADLQRTELANVVRRARRQAAYLGLDLGSGREVPKERSDLEKRMLWVCGRYHLPRPEVNVPIGQFTVDFLWHSHRVVVETDGWDAHRGRQAFEDDRTRDAYLRLGGYEVLRFSWRQLVDDPNPSSRSFAVTSPDSRMRVLGGMRQ